MSRWRAPRPDDRGDGSSPNPIAPITASWARDWVRSSEMWDAAAEVTAALERALTSFAEVVTGAAPGWLVLGVVLHLVNQVARGCGWCNLLRGATGERVRRSDAVLA